MIEAENLRLIYPNGTEALKPCSFSLRSGELVYVTGPSGSGKTSLMKLMMGIERPSEGGLSVLGERMDRCRGARLQKLRRRIGPVFQEFRMMPGSSAYENVLFGLRFLGMPGRTIREAAMDAMERVGLSHKAGERVEHLSWGECQRVAIARAVARRPALILADEPTGNLDRENAIRILELLASFRDAETSVVVTTHATHLIGLHPDAVSLRLEQGALKVERGELPG